MSSNSSNSRSKSSQSSQQSHSTPLATSTNKSTSLVKTSDTSTSTVCVITSSDDDDDDDEDCEPESPSLLHVSPTYDNPVKKYKVNESNTSLAKPHDLSCMVGMDTTASLFPAPTGGDEATGMLHIKVCLLLVTLHLRL